MKWWDWMPWFLFFKCWLLKQLFHSPLHLHQRLFISSSLSAIRVVSPAYLRLLIFLPAILIPACASSHPASCMVYSVCCVSCSVMSDSLGPHGLQHGRLCCSSPTPGAYLNSCPSSQWYHPTISSSVIPFSSHLQSFKHQGLFQRVSSSHQVARVLEFSFSICPSNEYSGLISFRLDWLDLIAVQETLKSLLQHHNSKASILQCLVVFIIQLSHPYMTTGNP